MDAAACTLSLGVGFTSGVIVYSAVLGVRAIILLLKGA